MKRAILVGAVVRDTVLLADGKRRRGLGGLAFAVEALAALASGSIEILPVCPVGEDLEPELRRRWRRLPGVRIDHLRVQGAVNPSVILDYRAPGTEPGERVERLVGPLPALEPGDVDGLPDADGLLVNCIAGDELTPEALESLTSRASLTQLDLHSRLLERLPDGTRRPRRPPDWRRWLGAVQVAQCNLAEAATLAGVEPDRSAGAAAVPLAVEALADRMTDAEMPRHVAVTSGRLGAWLLDRSSCTRFPAPSVETVDPTGAGDVFGAALLLARLQGAPMPMAVRRAVAVASASCRLQGVEELWQLQMPGSWPETRGPAGP